MATYIEPVNVLNAEIHIHKAGIYEALAYLVKAEYAQTGARHQEFRDFYESSIIQWLKHNKTTHAYAWLVGNYLICIGSPKMARLPWVGPSGIQGLNKFLAHERPVPVTNLRSYEG
jgi:hypothetical protein